MKMAGPWKREDELERRLRSERPEPRRELLHGLSAQVRNASSKRRQRRLGLSVALTTALLASLTAFGGIGYAFSSGTRAAKTSEQVTASQGQYGRKVDLCHHGYTIAVAQETVPAHLAIGDTIGACSDPADPPRHGGLTSAGKQYGVIRKVKICHRGHTLTVAETLVPAFLQLRDVKLGACSVKH
jgi:hypothetical protein